MNDNNDNNVNNNNNDNNNNSNITPNKDNFFNNEECKCNNTKYDKINYLLADIYELFESIDLFNEYTFYLDNLSTINYIFGNNTNKIMLFCTCKNSIQKIINTQTMLKKLIQQNNTGKYKYTSMVSNYYSSQNSNFETNTNRNFDSFSFLYKFDANDKQINITIYFFNLKLFFNEQRFNNLICEDFFYNTKQLFISSVYYCINDRFFYLINNDGIKKINDVNKIINISIQNGISDNGISDNGISDNGIIDNEIVDDGIIDNGIIDNQTVDNEISDNNKISEIEQLVDINEHLLLSNPDIFFDIFSYYLMTRDSKLNVILSNIVSIYSNNKQIKKKFKKQF